MLPGRARSSEQPSHLILLLLLTLFARAELINATTNFKHGFAQLEGARVEQRGDGEGGCAQESRLICLFLELLLSWTSKPDTAKLTGLLFASG